MYSRPSLLNMDLHPQKRRVRIAPHKRTKRTLIKRHVKEHDEERTDREARYMDEEDAGNFCALCSGVHKALLFAVGLCGVIIGVYIFHATHRAELLSAFDVQPEGQHAPGLEIGLSDIPKPTEFSDLPTYRADTLQNTSAFSQTDIPVANVDATASAIYDIRTGQVIASENFNERLPIASLTKMMTALVVMDLYGDRLDEEFAIVTPYQYDETEDWVLGLEAGDSITPREMLTAMLVSSYNDAAFNFALNSEVKGGGSDISTDRLSDSDINTEIFPTSHQTADSASNGNTYEQFIALMNAKAQQLGMFDTHFTNPAGYDNENNYSTARDLHVLVHKFMQDPILAEIVGQSSATINYAHQDGTPVSKLIYSTNKMYEPQYSAYYDVLGVKTGYTDEAGECFAGAFDVNDRQFGTIVLNANGRFEQTASLLDGLK